MIRWSVLSLVAACQPAPPSPPLPTGHAAEPPSAASAAPRPAPPDAPPTSTFEGSLPAPHRAHVLGEQADGTALVFVEGARLMTEAELARHNRISPRPLRGEVRLSVGYHLVLDAAHRCVVDTLSTPAFDEYKDTFAELGTPQNPPLPAAARAELDRLRALAARFGVRNLRDAAMAFGSAPERLAFETGSFVYTLDGSSVRGFGPGASVQPTASPSGTKIVASGCNPRCGDYVMIALTAGATKGTAVGRGRAADFAFHDEDTVTYLHDDGRGLADAKRLCVEEYSFATKANRQIRCFASKQGSEALQFSPKGNFATLELDNAGQRTTKILRTADFTEAWTLPTARPFLRVDDRGRVLYDDNDAPSFHERVHLVTPKGKELWEDSVAAGFLSNGHVLTLGFTGPSHEPGALKTLGDVRCSAFTDRTTRSE